VSLFVIDGDGERPTHSGGLATIATMSFFVIG